MIIGLIGKKRSGKDTLADYLVTKHGFEKYSFGDPVKMIAKLMFNLSDDQLNTNLKEEIDSRWNLTPREIFQTIGTEFGRDFLHKTLPHINVKMGQFWIRKCEVWYHEKLKKNPNINVVIADVRFQNEFDSIKKLNGSFIKILRDNNLIDQHISENDINNLSKEINFIIENNTTINDFYNKFNKLNIIN